jgi:hypothetical protein
MVGPRDTVSGTTPMGSALYTVPSVATIEMPLILPFALDTSTAVAAPEGFAR